jgi:DNA-binding NarL/FixJ family response regulator
MSTDTATAVKAAHLRILVADDSEAMRRALRRVLERHVDWEVCGEASNGREAVEKAAQCGPDVILLDFQMPEMNGLEAAKEMRRRTPEIPILMVTMHMSPQLAVEARKVGVRGTCSKTEIGCLMEAVQTLRQNGTYYRN